MSLCANSLFNLIMTVTAITVPNSAVYSFKYQMYIAVHIIALLSVVVFLFLTMRAKTSKAQTAVCIFELGAIFYNVGFIQEIISDTPEGGYIACISQYVGETIVFVAVVFFVSQLCSVKVPPVIYIVQVIFSLFSLAILCTTRLNGLFYQSVGLNTSGPFSRPEIDHGVAFYVFAAYMFIVSVWVMKVSIKDYKKASPIQRKRLAHLIASLIFCWLPYGLTLSGITNGYEIPAVGVALAAVGLYFCFIKYGFFDSQVLAGSNALEHGNEGIIVVDSSNIVTYQNRRIKDIFGTIPEASDMTDYPILGEVLKGNLKQYENNGRYYEFSVEPIKEAGYVMGSMIWVIDSTEHYEHLKRMEELAERDTLTGIYNRNHFQKLVETDLNSGSTGTMVMFDMDNFKGVNDTYGHQCGDEVLTIFANMLKKYGEERLYSCRLGGDEFCVFIRKTNSRAELESVLRRIFEGFKEDLSKAGHEGLTTLSAGAAGIKAESTFKSLYSEADKNLYVAKTSGKDHFVIS